jgi:putative membrane protein
MLMAAGVATLAAAWLGPLPDLASRYFSAHMTMHMAVVAVAAPLLALGASGAKLDPSRPLSRALAPIPLSVLELAIVWGWHAPALHHLARSSTAGLVAEQTMFLVSGLLLWVASFGWRGADHGRSAAGVVALLLTSMHMTLLGALIALAPRPLYAHATVVLGGETALEQQQLGGTIMLLVGGVSYLAGGLWLSAIVLEKGVRERRSVG